MSLVAFLILVVGGGLLIGAFTGPEAWFDQLLKPSFNPSAWVFAPVWTALYIMIAIAGWRTWKRSPGAPWSGMLMLWGVQLALNFLWSPTFFAAHRIDLALAIIVLLLATIVAFIVAALRSNDRISAALFAPYALWVGFATALNYGFYRLNGAG